LFQVLFILHKRVWVSVFKCHFLADVLSLNVFLCRNLSRWGRWSLI
jgi:hypothetical protein